MITHPELLVPHAEAALIEVPEDLTDYDPFEYPWWDIYLKTQLWSPVPDWDAPAHNAHIISRIPEEEIRTIKFKQLLERGYQTASFNSETVSKFEIDSDSKMVFSVCFFGCIVMVLIAVLFY